MKIIILILSTFILLIASDFDELNLLSDLNNASEISTKTKLNIDKTPSIISILQADELKKVGVTNLHEALGTVPGIQIFMGSGGAKQISMRGNKSLTEDKLKLMINGISINTEVLGTTYFYMDMPIENIERIEVVRGPASTIYGSFAHVGAINVITKSSRHNENIYFLNTSSQGTTNSGFTQNLDINTLKIALDASFTNNEKSRDTGAYVYNGGQIDQATSYEDFTNYSVGGIIKFNDKLSLQARFAQFETQNMYGYGDWPITHDPKKLKTTSILSELRYVSDISKNISIDLHAGYKNYVFDGFTRLKPYATTLGTAFDLIGDGYYEEHVFYTDNTLSYTLNKHELLFGIYLSQSEEDSKTYYYINSVTTSAATTIFNQAIQPDISRYQYALYFNDIYSISDKLIANIGLRYDHYNDVDSNLAHKLALLYNHDEKQNYKFMYQRSFRAPSWLELYGDEIPYKGTPSIKPETIDTFEIAYNYKNNLASSLKINFFYSKMKDFINQYSDYYFYNDSNRNSFGTEIEVKLPLSEFTSLQANYSHVTIEDSTGKAIPLIANDLANIMIIHDINANYSSGTQIKYIGKKRHDSNDPRAAISAYATLDQTLSYTKNKFTFQISAKNIFDQDIVDPSSYSDGNEYATGTYINDYRRNGRTFWICAEWRFE